MDITTKYNIDQEVWTMLNNKPICIPITNIIVRVEKREIPNTFNQYEVITEISYTLQSRIGHFSEEELFLTKEDLIKYLFKDYE